MDSELIYDVGANNGDDTAHYLSMGYRVVAIEANPRLAERLYERFPAETSDGRLTVANVGIWETAGVLDFYVNDDNDEHSSFEQRVGARPGTRSHVEQIETQPFDAILSKYGVPYYLKVDIETADVFCIKALDPSDLPAYVSIEAHYLDYLTILWNLGYRQFKVVDQAGHNRPAEFDNESFRGRVTGWIEHQRRRVDNHVGSHRYAPASSGPFGEDTPGEWREMQPVAYDWLHYTYQQTYRGKRGTLNMRGWYDFHAKL